MLYWFIHLQHTFSCLLLNTFCVSVHSIGINMFQVMKALLPFNKKFRVLALSATPGCNLQAVTQVCLDTYVASALLEPSRINASLVCTKWQRYY
jgi:hypothetical protein